MHLENGDVEGLAGKCLVGVPMVSLGAAGDAQEPAGILMALATT